MERINKLIEIIKKEDEHDCLVYKADVYEEYAKIHTCFLLGASHDYLNLYLIHEDDNTFSLCDEFEIFEHLDDIYECNLNLAATNELLKKYNIKVAEHTLYIEVDETNIVQAFINYFLFITKVTEIDYISYFELGSVFKLDKIDVEHIDREHRGNRGFKEDYLLYKYYYPTLTSLVKYDEKYNRLEIFDGATIKEITFVRKERWSGEVFEATYNNDHVRYFQFSEIANCKDYNTITYKNIPLYSLRNFLLIEQALFPIKYDKDISICMIENAAQEGEVDDLEIKDLTRYFRVRILDYENRELGINPKVIGNKNYFVKNEGTLILIQKIVGDIYIKLR